MLNDQYKKMKNLFLRQSYIDAWEDYQRSIRKKSYAQWDYIVLTASNEEQAEAFRSQISYRQGKNVLPCRTKYMVLPDPDGKRVGSGGAVQRTDGVPEPDCFADADAGRRKGDPGAYMTALVEAFIVCPWK